MVFGLSRVERVTNPVLLAVVRIHEQLQQNALYFAIYSGNKCGVDYNVQPDQGAIRLWVRLPQDEFGAFADDFEKKLREGLAKRLSGVPLELTQRDAKFYTLMTRIITIVVQA